MAWYRRVRIDARVAKPPRSGDLSHSRCHVLHRLQSSVMSMTRALARLSSADLGGAAAKVGAGRGGNTTRVVGGSTVGTGRGGTRVQVRSGRGSYVFARCAAFDCIHLAGRVRAINPPWSHRHPLKKAECTRNKLAIPAHRHVERIPHHCVTTASPVCHHQRHFWYLESFCRAGGFVLEETLTSGC